MSKPKSLVPNELPSLLDNPTPAAPPQAPVSQGTRRPGGGAINAGNPNMVVGPGFYRTVSDGGVED